MDEKKWCDLYLQSKFKNCDEIEKMESINEMKDFKTEVWGDHVVSILPFTERQAELIVSSEQHE